jgi:hypothetical protein
VDINNAWETIREDIKIAVKESVDYYELQSNVSIVSTNNTQTY